MKKHHYFLFWFLILTFLIYVLSYWTNSVSLFFDMPSVFATLMEEPANKSRFWYHVISLDVRFFTNILVSIPYNILYHIFKDTSLLALSNSYTLSFFIIQFLAILYNFILARKTKRYDIAIASLAFYMIFSMPNMLWVIRECHITVILYFTLLSYFLSKTKLSKVDLIPITLLLLYLFESYEITFVFGIILFVFMHMYAKRKDDINIWYKVYIGFIAFAASLYIPCKLLFLVCKKGLVLSSGYGWQEWINSLISTIDFSTKTNCIIFLFSLFVLVMTSFVKKHFSKNSSLFFVPLFWLLYYCLTIGTGMYPSPGRELHHYTIVFVFIFPVILFLLLIDYYNVEKFLYLKNSYDESKYFWPNVFIIACLFGCANMFWQIFSNCEYGKYVSYLKNMIKSSNEKVLYIPESDYKKYRWLRDYNNCLGLMTRAMLLSETKEINKIIYPSAYMNDYKAFCFHEREYNYYDKNDKRIRIQNQMYKLKTDVWDLTPIYKLYLEEGKVK